MGQHTTRYASHYLRLGSWRCTYPLLTRCDDGTIQLEPFSQEVASTIFVNGEIRLVCPDYPLQSSYEDISLEQAQEQITHYQGWQIILP